MPYKQYNFFFISNHITFFFALSFANFVAKCLMLRFWAVTCGGCFVQPSYSTAALWNENSYVFISVSLEKSFTGRQRKTKILEFVEQTQHVWHCTYQNSQRNGAHIISQIISTDIVEVSMLQNFLQCLKICANFWRYKPWILHTKPNVELFSCICDNLSSRDWIGMSRTAIYNSSLKFSSTKRLFACYSYKLHLSCNTNYIWFNCWRYSSGM
jgi:hypothetical protein